MQTAGKTAKKPGRGLLTAGKARGLNGRPLGPQWPGARRLALRITRNHAEKLVDLGLCGENGLRRGFLPWHCRNSCDEERQRQQQTWRGWFSAVS